MLRSKCTTSRFFCFIYKTLHCLEASRGQFLTSLKLHIDMCIMYVCQSLQTYTRFCGHSVLWRDLKELVCEDLNRIHLEFWGFGSGVAEHFVFVGYDAALMGSRIPTFWGKVESSSSRVKMSSKCWDPITH
jgi:hypothetical protein